MHTHAREITARDAKIRSLESTLKTKKLNTEQLVMNLDQKIIAMLPAHAPVGKQTQ